MAFDIAVLKTEATLLKYAGQIPASIAADLNVKRVVAPIDVPGEMISRKLIGLGVLGKLDARVEFHRSKLAAAPAVDGAAETALSNLFTARRSVELLPSFLMSDGATNTFVAAMLASLVAEGVMTAGQRTALLAMASGFISRGEELFGRGTVIEAGHVAKAVR